MPIRFRDPAIKNTGIRSLSQDDTPNLSGGLNFKRNKFGSNKNINPHLRQVGIRDVGFRQASVPIRGLRSRSDQSSLKIPKSVSARSAAKGDFSFKNMDPYR